MMMVLALKGVFTLLSYSYVLDREGVCNST